jgi:hypothetical protein
MRAAAPQYDKSVGRGRRKSGISRALRPAAKVGTLFDSLSTGIAAGAGPRALKL